MQKDRARKTEIVARTGRSLRQVAIHARSDRRAPNAAGTRARAVVDSVRLRRLRTVRPIAANRGLRLNEAAATIGTVPRQVLPQHVDLARATTGSVATEMAITAELMAAVERVRNSTCGSPSCARLLVADMAIRARVVAARLRVMADAEDPVVGAHRADARTAEVVGTLAVAAEVMQAVVVDIPAVAEDTAAVAIAKQVVVSRLAGRSKNQSEERNRGEKGVLNGTPFLLFRVPCPCLRGLLPGTFRETWTGFVACAALRQSA
jgi:hypothetical protein